MLHIIDALILFLGKKGAMHEAETEVTHSFASFSNDSSCSGCGHLDVSFQFDLLLWPKEVLLLQFAIDSALSLLIETNRLTIQVCFWQTHII